MQVQIPHRSGLSLVIVTYIQVHVTENRYIYYVYPLEYLGRLEYILNMHVADSPIYLSRLFFSRYLELL